MADPTAIRLADPATIRWADPLAIHYPGPLQCPHAERFMAALAERDVSLSHHTAQLTKLLERHGARALDAALTEALDKGAVGAPAVAHLLDQRTRRRRDKPPLAVVLPDDPRIAASRVVPHALTDYDRLLTHQDTDSDDDTTR